MPKNKGIHNNSNPLMNDLIERYLCEFKNSFIGEYSIKGFDSCDGSDFIDKNEKAKIYISNIRQETNNGKFVQNQILDVFIETLSEDSYLDSYLALSVIHYLHAQYLYDYYHNSDHHKALMNIALALNFIGKFSGASTFKFFNEKYNPSKLNLIENATKGGNASNKRFIPTKKKVIELIENEKPKAGWKDNEEFIELMGDKLIQFNRSNGRIMSEGNMLKTVMKWLGSDKMVAPVFSANSIS